MSFTKKDRYDIKRELVLNSSSPKKNSLNTEKQRKGEMCKER